MGSRENHIMKAVMLSILAFAAFSISDGLRKLMALSYDLPDILFWQAVCGLALVLIVAPFVGGRRALFNAKTMKWQCVRGIVIALNTSFSIMAISRIPIVDAYTIFFLTPFAVTLMGAVVFKEVIGKFRILSIFCGFFGAFVAFRPGFAELNPAYLYALVCVFTFSSSSILARHIGNASGLLSFALWPFLCLIAGGLIYKGGVMPVSYPLSFWCYMVVIGAAYAIAMVLISYSFTLAPASVLAPYQYTQIIFALGFGYFLFGDVPDIPKIIGASIIVGSGIFLFTRERMQEKRKRKEPA